MLKLINISKKELKLLVVTFFKFMAFVSICFGMCWLYVRSLLTGSVLTFIIFWFFAVLGSSIIYVRYKRAEENENG